ncbi:MAG: glycine--tRNA ligase subunit beta [Betaproteobacteria bacterium]|uniref:Glycine--tRNA ligase beta subunit n=1 Tax=Candidatus Proximibacter danicus TaxID=2954365 RepID=A0A9D7PQK0_9PROT|nr:glycine--tRNA ligase subunit beta [Candidatus Proximibacter danicus]
MNKTLLIELRTEELPPKALAKLGEVFAAGVHAGLSDRNLVQAGGDYKWFATPRRLAIQVPAVLAEAPDAKVHEKIMPVSVALDAAGNPSPALLKKLEAKGIPASEVAKFEKRMDGKSETFFYEATVKGVKLENVLGQIVGEALKKLPIPKVMRWGDSDVQFVRPVHGLVMLHGEHVVSGEVLGLKSGNTTLGHRFLSDGAIVLASADEYETKLESVGKAVVSFARRRDIIAKALQAKADELGAKVKLIDALVDEVTALVEWPVIYVSEFESEYLEVPQECLILTMQANQKYFPLFDANGKLQNRFLIVSNMAVADPTNIITGNARVVRPRLSDARFFFEQDKKNGFVSRAMKLGSVVYHNKLGSLGDRAQRLGVVAAFVADKLGADTNQARNAGLLCKVDLLTDMVGEFPELQGIMGRYYAQHEGAKPDVAEAMEQHYRPRFAGDVLPESNVSCAVALADKLDALVGFFGIGQVPTGDKDPFGLRRAALGVLRILMENPLPLDLAELIAETAKAFPTGMLAAAGFEAQVHDFMLDRLRGYLRDAGHAQDAVEAVLVQRPTRIDLVPAKLEAVKRFVAHDAALALAAANKRIGNILKKAEGAIPEPDVALLQEAAEKALFERVIQLAPLVKSHVTNGDYTDALLALSGVRAEVDRFFDEVMVNVDEPLVRANRLGLLKALFDQLNAVADISKLAV